MKVIFQNHSGAEFHQALKKDVETYFKEKNLSPKASPFLWLKTGAILMLELSLYLLLLSNRLNSLGFILVFIFFGMALALTNLVICHDALHGAFSAKRGLNKAIGYLFDLNGTSSFIWKYTHNVLHHTFTNIPGHDQDIDKAILLRLNPKDPLLFFHYYQNIYAFFLYPLVSFSWVLYGDYLFFFREYQTSKATLKDLFIFFGFKFLNLFLLVGLPLWLVDLPIGIILLGYLCKHLVAGLAVSLIFQLAHIVDNVAYFEPDQRGQVTYHWAIHELHTTANFATRSSLLTHLIGGLNYQIEHHLFPHVSHVHYPAIQKFVKKRTQEFQLPYHENATLWLALCSHYKRLKRLGREQELDPSLELTI